ncbi:Nse4 C-terminal-domain-containing protein [Suillus cothurnatus]|nr:Nse4 C-terminal-domain-containing protein [Suillus cothurnatus]
MPSDFTTEDFVSKLESYLKGPCSTTGLLSEEVHITLSDWERVGRRALAKSRRVPIPTFMNGPTSMKNGASVDFLSDHDLVRPSTARESSSDNKPEEQLVNEILDILRTTGPLNLFQFIVNPSSFGQSVENLYYMLFLIRDGLCGVDLSMNGEPIVSAKDSPTENVTGSQSNQCQMIWEFDVATWQRAIEVFNIRECVIPHRAGQT